MRYYEVHRPGEPAPMIVTNVRRLRDLPMGTRVYRTITDHDGSLIDHEELGVRDGRVLIAGHGKHRPKILYTARRAG